MYFLPNDRLLWSDQGRLAISCSNSAIVDIIKLHLPARICKWCIRISVPYQNIFTVLLCFIASARLLPPSVVMPLNARL